MKKNDNVIKTINNLETDKIFGELGLGLQLEINDITRYNGNWIDLGERSETIEVTDREVIHELLEYIKKYADDNFSPQSLFEYKGYNYLSYQIEFEDPDGNKKNTDTFKMEVINELKDILGKTAFSVPYDEIIDITISHPEIPKHLMELLLEEGI